jgi:PEP-CTERM motif
MHLRVVSTTVLLGGLMCATLPAAQVFTGSFDIAGTITVANGGAAGCPVSAQCISWTDTANPAVPNKADISAIGLTGDFASIPGFAGNDAANIFNLTNPPNVVDAAGFPPQTFLSFNNGGVTTSLLINFIFAGIFPPAGCPSAAVGATCTVPGSLFNFVNNPGGPTGSQATATWALSGVTSEGVQWTGNFTSQFNVPTPTVLNNLATNGFVTNTYSATITLTPIPEAGTMALFGIGLVGLSMKLRRRMK